MFLEIRNHETKQVSFSAVTLDNDQWFWNDVKLEEPWWVTLAAASDNILLFTIYADTNNPDKKSVLAMDVHSKKIIWWRNDFAISTVTSQIVTGIDTKFGSQEVGLNIFDGKELRRDTAVLPIEQNFKVIRPFQYHEGSQHFETVHKFLKKKEAISPVIMVEYIEYGSLIVISAFTGPQNLANYLFVFNSGGEMLIKEILGEHLKGIAQDTFFIVSGYLIFVKNKSELVCYRMV